MIRRTALFWMFLASLAIALPELSAAAAEPQPAPGDLLKAKLVADVSSVEPGKPFTIGVLMTMAPGWHVYWINPGDSGQTPSVQWKLPPGFTAGELQFPTPTRIDLPGGLVNYGYLDDVLFTATITPPKDLPPGTTNLPIDAEVTWLVCNEDGCVPGDAKLHLDLGSSRTSAPANQRLFGRWSERLPAPAVPAKLTWQVAPAGNGARARFTLQDLTAPSPQWFPAPGEDFRVKDINIVPSAGAVQVSFTLEPLAGRKLGSEISFPSVLAYSQNGRVRGISVPVRLTLTGNSSAAARSAGR